MKRDVSIFCAGINAAYVNVDLCAGHYGLAVLALVGLIAGLVGAYRIGRSA